MNISNINIWLLMIKENDILGETPNDVVIEFKSNEDFATVKANLNSFDAVSQISLQDLEHHITEEKNIKNWSKI